MMMIAPNSLARQKEGVQEKGEEGVQEKGEEEAGDQRKGSQTGTQTSGADAHTGLSRSGVLDGASKAFRS